MREVVERQLWIGNAHDARNLPVLHEHGIRAVIDLAAEELPAELSRDLMYCRIPLTDDDGNEDWLLRAAVDTTVRFVQEHGAAYLDWLKSLHANKHGNADIVAYFFRQSFDSLRTTGTLGRLVRPTPAIAARARTGRRDALPARPAPAASGAHSRSRV